LNVEQELVDLDFWKVIYIKIVIFVGFL
jgi:hypothetical protein